MHMERVKLMHTQSTYMYPYASTVASDLGWTSFLVLKLNSLFLEYMEA